MELSDLTRSFEKGDLARPNLFMVEIPYLGENFTVKCKAATAPAAIVEKILVGFLNRKSTLAGDRTFDDWTCSIYADEEHKTRQDILNWQAIAAAQGNEITGGKPADYKKVAIVKHYGRDVKEVTKTYTMFGIWPSNVGEITLDWDTNSEVEIFEVTWAYDYWE